MARIISSRSSSSPIVYTKQQLKNLNTQSQRPMTFGAIYTWLLQEYPVATMTIQTVIINCTSKFAANYLKKDPVPSITDLIIVALIAAFYINPLLMSFFGFLQKQTSEQMSATYKLVLDQLIFSPAFTFGIISMSMVLTAVLNDQKIAHYTICINAGRAVINVVPLAWAFWLLQRLFSKSFIPDIYSLTFNSICSFFWTCIFQYVTSA